MPAHFARHLARPAVLAIGLGVALAATSTVLMPGLGAGVGLPDVTTANCHACGRNLIANPGAEAGKGANGDYVVKVPDWRTTGDFTAELYTSGEDLSPTTPGPGKRGKNYFYGGPYATESTGTQVIKVGTSGILTGKVAYLLSAWLGGYADQGDYATLTVSFESAAGKVLNAVTLGPVTAAQRHDNSELLERQRAGMVPAATAQIKVELVMVKLVGGDDDGMADNLSLVFSPASTA
jgi:hypothetical protein